MSTLRLRCPACGKPTGVRLVYGFPSSELMDAAERGEVALGGCCLPLVPTHFRCLACEHECADPAAGADDPED